MTDKTTTAIPVKQIVTNYLRLHGFGGLCNAHDCGCNLYDFMPCDGESIQACKPGYAAFNEAGDDIIQPEKPPCR